jgi:hypothetical protein
MARHAFYLPRFFAGNVLSFFDRGGGLYFFAQKPGDVFLPSGYSLSGHTAHFYSIHILLSEEK